MRRDILSFGEFQDARDGVVYLGNFAQDLFIIITVELGGYVYESTRVDGVVGSVDDTALEKSETIGISFQLVVSATGNDFALELRDGASVQDSTQSARSEDIAINGVNLVGSDHFGAEFLDDFFDLIRIDVGDDQLGSGSGEVAG